MDIYIYISDSGSIWMKLTLWSQVVTTYPRVDARCYSNIIHRWMYIIHTDASHCSGRVVAVAEPVTKEGSVNSTTDEFLRCYSKFIHPWMFIIHMDASHCSGRVVAGDDGDGDGGTVTDEGCTNSKAPNQCALRPESGCGQTLHSLIT
jgi:hypothetical protein